ncbi:MAG: glycosyl hydrolase [Firmicutes bacterium]|nr:glycosyl hydrolase [Bacillota bacterium]
MNRKIYKLLLSTIVLIIACVLFVACIPTLPTSTEETLSDASDSSTSSYVPKPPPERSVLNNYARGVGYSFRNSPQGSSSDLHTADDFRLLQEGEHGIGWFYNWAVQPGSDLVESEANYHNVNFVPMNWGQSMSDAGENNIRNFVNRQRERGIEVRYLRTMNEVNITNQGGGPNGVTPQHFATNPNSWPRMLRLARELDLKIISPALAHGNVGGANSRFAGEQGGVTWIVEFFQEIIRLDNPERYGTIEDIHAISVHTYTSWPSHFKVFIERFHNTLYEEFGVRVPIWVTEWCAWYYIQWGYTNPAHVAWSRPYFTRENGVRWQAWHMSQTVAWMEQSPFVDKYAWFIPKRGVTSAAYPMMELLTNTTPPQLTELGIIYTNMSVFDQDYWFRANEIIDIAQMTRNNIYEWVGCLDEGTRYGFSESVNFWPVTDTDTSAGALEVRDLAGGRWIEFQIYVERTDFYVLDLRYRATVSSSISVIIDGNSQESVLHSSNWDTTSIDLGVLEKGYHTLRIVGNGPRVSTGWPDVQNNHNNNLMLNWMQLTGFSQ